MKPGKITQIFFASSAIVLLLTASGKGISFFFGSSIILFKPDPIFGVPFRYLMAGSALLEIAVGCYCLLVQNVFNRALLISWFAAVVASYRIWLVLIGWRQPCNCLGGFVEVLHLSNQSADMIARGILVYLGLGSLTLLAMKKQRRLAQA